ncbi:MAG: hypothetical protein CMN28_10455 [Salinisphaeraceae bacterium]|nr:hypothetical protein [Salinisphaeraceae bacterium]
MCSHPNDEKLGIAARKIRLIVQAPSHHRSPAGPRVAESANERGLTLMTRLRLLDIVVNPGISPALHYMLCLPVEKPMNAYMHDLWITGG